jgi:hypothetical protein
MGISIFPIPSTAVPTKTLGLSVLSTNASITSLPTNKEITAVVIGGGGGAGRSGSAGTISGGGTSGAGSGQIREYTFTLKSAVTAGVTIGAGGAGTYTQNGSGYNGGNTVLTVPGFATVTAPGGNGSNIPPGPGGGSGGGSGGGGYNNGSAGGNGGIFGTTGTLTPVVTTYATTTIAPCQDPNATNESYQIFMHAVTSGSTSITIVGNRLLNLMPGASMQIRSDNILHTLAWNTGNGVFALSNNYNGESSSSLSSSIPAYLTSKFSVLKESLTLLAAANITLPGGGGGGSGAKSNNTLPANAGGRGAGTGGNGGTGAVTGSPGSVTANATAGGAGAQPGGGAGGTGGFGWNGTGGPGASASGGAGAVYFFWAA